MKNLPLKVRCRQTLEELDRLQFIREHLTERFEKGVEDPVLRGEINLNSCYVYGLIKALLEGAGEIIDEHYSYWQEKLKNNLKTFKTGTEHDYLDVIAGEHYAVFIMLNKAEQFLNEWRDRNERIR